MLPVESYLAGTVLEILVKEGDDVTSGDVLMMIGSGAAAPRPAAAPAVQTPAAPAAPAAGVLDEEEYIPIIKGAAPTPRPAAPAAAKALWPAMPNAKMLARELGVELAGLTPANEVMLTRKDVRAAQAAALAAEQARPAPAAAPAEAPFHINTLSESLSQ